ncbi:MULTISPECIES: class I SAM-dependent methyltransferase [Pseudovibrio]|uniref:class I SAM-dependent methyltransferase n=1 Tax=Stappiaceae TaxID=2821832 RepID=UPI002366895C|nr:MULTISPECIES: class I SAM-dependent methyltransferase [Pseudovibrio]MDD7909112.1 class I SAM-dependent methyltransferase [Pseudovibrio exalbescens]MDX5593566.1 class I SAM-dependent methyltransferase [Pseudovibrio sp. SPO723]
MKNASTADGWDEEYRQGRWAFLRSLPESGRYGIIGMWLALTNSNEEILDIGCGEGLLYERLAPMGVKRYVGMDLAPAALEIADVDPSIASLRAGDMHTFEPNEGETFSAIIFNEVLHFAEDPGAVVARYVPYLKEDGVIALSMYSPKRPESGANKLIAKLWEATDDESKWEVLDDYALRSDKKNVTWRMRLVKPVR